MRATISLLLICLFIISCSKERDYEFVIYNKTHFRIDALKIDNNIEIAIEPNDTSETITWHFDGTYFDFAEPLVSFTVTEYSDSVSAFENSLGELASIPDLTKKSVNSVEITLVDDYQNKDYIFDIVVNK